MKTDDTSKTFSSQLPIVMNYPKVDLYEKQATNRPLEWTTETGNTNKFVKVHPKLTISKLLTKS